MLKYKLTITKDNGDIIEKDYKSYKEMAKILNIPYHHVRSLHLESLPEHKRKYLHPTLKKLAEKIKIVSIEPNMTFDI